MIKKITLLMTSGLITSILIILDQIGTFNLCGAKEYGQCMDFVYSVLINITPIIPLFLVSIITYKMRDEVYHAWLRFTYVWIPLSVLLIFLAPEYTTDWMLPVVKGTVAFFSSLLFLIISLVLIAWKHFSLRSKSQI